MLNSTTAFNFAHGGATSDNAIVLAQTITTNGTTVPIPSVRDQVNSYVALPEANVTDSRALHIMWGGHNDFILKLSEATTIEKLEVLLGHDFQTDIVDSLMGSLQILLDNGANYVLMMKLAPLARTFYLSQEVSCLS